MLVNLKSALHARRVKQIDLALKLRVPPSVLSDVIHGRRKAEASLRERIARELNADPEWLFKAYVSIPSYARDMDAPPTVALAAEER